MAEICAFCWGCTLARPYVFKVSCMIWHVMRVVLGWSMGLHYIHFWYTTSWCRPITVTTAPPPPPHPPEVCFKRRFIKIRLKSTPKPRLLTQFYSTCVVCVCVCASVSACVCACLCVCVCVCFLSVRTQVHGVHDRCVSGATLPSYNAVSTFICPNHCSSSALLFKLGG